MSKRGVAPLLGAMAIVALIVFGGCGGSDDESTSTAASTAGVTVETSSITKAEHAKQVNEICSRGTDKVTPLVRKVIASGSGVERVEAAFLPVIDGWVTEIQALGAPNGEEAKVEAFLTALEGDLKEAESKPAKSMEELGATFAKSGEIARSSGFEACALG